MSRTEEPLISTAAYFDCNATTHTLPVAADAALRAMRVLYGNPSSSHMVGLQAKHILESVRKTAGQVISVDPNQIIFTSGATEAIQTAIFSVLQSYVESPSEATRLLYSATEHKAVPQALRHWVKMLRLPLEIIELPVDSQGQLKLDVLRRELPHALMLCTMAVNNETGVVQNLAAVEKILLETKSPVRWLVDCVQALGKLPLNLGATRVDYAAFSGHKLYAPKGIGFLYARKSAPLVPLIVGGGQERGMRSGTENLPGVAAFGAVLELLLVPGGAPQFQSHTVLEGFRKQLITELRRAFPKVEYNTPFEHSVPTTLNFSVPGFSNKELIDLFDSAGMRLSGGSACSATSVEPSHVLDAMGFPEWRSTSALRLSFGPCTKAAEVERGCRVIRESAMALQNSCLLDAPFGFEPPQTLRDGVIQFRAGASNSWIISHSEARTCVIIDPCETVADRIEHYVRCQNLEVLAVLDTHSHADHVSIRPVLQKLLSDRMQAAGIEFDSLGWPLQPEILLEDGTKASALRLGAAKDGGEMVLARIHTPGHTDDSQAFLFGRLRGNRLAGPDIRFAFSGDTILSGGLGRTNFSISDPEGLFSSLRRIHSVLGPLSLLCPAHDYNNSFATCLKTEEQENPILALAVKPPHGVDQAATLSLFLNKKREIDSELERIEQNFQGVVCGVAHASNEADEADILISADTLRARIHGNGAAKTGRATLVVDVREPQEFLLFKDWNALGLNIAPRNVPLSRFVNFMSELAASGKDRTEVVFICRSGNRSLQAAKSLRRLGLAQAFSLKGGISL